MPSVIIGKDAETGQVIRLTDIERRSGLSILGRPGTGKTTLIKRIIEQDIQHGHGVFFLDPHGDAIDDLQKRIPSERQKDVIVLDPADEAFSFGINLLECPDPANLTARTRTFAQAIDVFKKLFANIQTGELDVLLNQYLRNSFFPLLANQGYTIAEIPLFLTDKQFRDRLLQHPAVRPQVVRFWRTVFDRLPLDDQRKEIASTERRLDQFQDYDQIRHIVGRSTSTLDFTKVMDTGKILFVKLSATLPPDVHRIIGTILISNLVHAVLLRESVPQEERRHFCIFVDEFQNFASSDDFAILFTQARKYAIATTIAHQERYGQFADNKRISGATDAAVNKIFFQVSVRDAEEQAPEFARRASDTRALSGGELVFSPHPLEDLWEKGHPDPAVMYIRGKYFWIAELLRRPPQEQYFVFDPSHVSPEYRQENPLNYDRQSFRDWEYYRSSVEMIRQGIALLNQYYYDWMHGRYQPATLLSNAQVALMIKVIECLGGVYGFLPMFRPYIPEPMRHALFRVLEQHKPRYAEGFTRNDFTNSLVPYVPSYNVKTTVDDADFPRILLPYVVPEEYFALRDLYKYPEDKLKWWPGHPLSEHEYYRRVRLCHKLIGIDCHWGEPKTPDIPTTLTDMVWFQGIRQLAIYIGMSSHEFENLIAWEVSPLERQEKEALAAFVTLLWNLVVGKVKDPEGARINQRYAAVIATRCGVSGNASPAAETRLLWQIEELSQFITDCLCFAPSVLAGEPLKVPSGKYDETPTREKTQSEMIDEMVQELIGLKPHTAYVKSGWKGKLQTLLEERDAQTQLVDVSGIARKNAQSLGILRARSDIEREIRERQDNWRRRPGDQPPPPGYAS
jgi:hypothetical protein